MVLRAPDVNTEVASSETSDVKGQESSTAEQAAQEQTKDVEESTEQADDTETATDATGDEQTDDQQDSQSQQDDKAQEGQNILERLKNEWKCHEIGCSGHLEIFTYNKINDTWYHRICSNAPLCKNRTKAQKYTPEVKGIIKKTS